MDIPAPAHTSTFEAMAEATKPRTFDMQPIIDNLKPVEKMEALYNLGRIINLTWDTTIDKLIVIMGVNYNRAHRPGEKPTGTEVVVFDLYDFAEWLKENDLLTMQFGEVDDPQHYHISFEDYMAEHCQISHVAQFVEDKGERPTGYKWYYPKPDRAETV